MNYQPSLPEHNDNISHEHPLREFFILISGVVAIVLIIFWSLGFFIDFAVKHISPEDEAKIYAKLGHSFDFGLETQPVNTNLQELLNQLAECAEIPYPVTMQLVKTNEINALALPAGNILLFSGLLNTVHSENGLAFVLAHELGHFKNRDHLRGMGRGIVLVALSVILTGANSDISRLLAPTTGLGQAQYSQQAESAADKTALQILNCHYGHIGGSTEFFEFLKKKQGADNNKLSHYFQSHPQVEKRIKAVNKLAEKMGFEFGAVSRLSN